MATKEQALAAARKRWGKDRAFIRENRRALSPAQRAERSDHVKRVGELIKASEAEQKLLAAAPSILLSKAEFYLAVNGDEPSNTEFRAAVADARKLADLKEDCGLLRKEHENLRSGIHVTRWEAGHVVSAGGFGFSSIDVHADTLDELVERIRGKSKSEAVTP
jgi:hypothetical protein